MSWRGTQPIKPLSHGVLRPPLPRRHLRRLQQVSPADSTDWLARYTVPGKLIPGWLAGYTRDPVIRRQRNTLGIYRERKGEGARGMRGTDASNGRRVRVYEEMEGEARCCSSGGPGWQCTGGSSERSLAKGSPITCIGPPDTGMAAPATRPHAAGPTLIPRGANRQLDAWSGPGRSRTRARCARNGGEEAAQAASSSPSLSEA
jgi:hypothetical protein